MVRLGCVSTEALSLLSSEAALSLIIRGPVGHPRPAGDGADGEMNDSLSVMSLKQLGLPKTNTVPLDSVHTLLRQSHIAGKPLSLTSPISKDLSSDSPRENEVSHQHPPRHRPQGHSCSYHVTAGHSVQW